MRFLAFVVVALLGLFLGFFGGTVLHSLYILPRWIE